MIDIFEREASVRATLFKHIHLENYIPNFDLLVAAGFFNITAKYTLRNFVIPRNMVKFTVVDAEVLIYGNTDKLLKILLIDGCYIKKTMGYQFCTFAKGPN